ncbi:MAG TPA: HEAT repeat domain-containing protein [Thermoanaerobaculia bacterium]|nr:HEAT repeat domain-containing protein [Thermoanaerobaculia bacterium]
MDPLRNPTPSWEECVEILERLPSLPFDSRIEALERLVRNPSPGIREQALRIGANLLPDTLLTEYLRNDSDAVLRNAGSEILRLRGGRSLPALVGLLEDPDSDVVLQAVLILGRLSDPRALEPLHGVLGHTDPNVVQEAILAVGRLGDARSIPRLLPFLDSDLWLQMAAVQALGDLRSPEAIPFLAERLTDPMVGSLAAEALARIGGRSAFDTLASHWPAGGVEVEEETLLGLLAHVLEGLPAPPETRPAGFREALSARLHDRSQELRTAAARCLLILGPSTWDDAALEVLEAASPSPGVLPVALGRRSDLLRRLLAAEGPARAWGFLLAARFPGEVPAEEILYALASVAERPELLPAAAQLLVKVRLRELAPVLLDLYLRLPANLRSALEPAIDVHREGIAEALAAQGTVDEADRLVLSALLGSPVDEIAKGIMDLPAPLRPGAVSRLIQQEELIRVLPWEDWLMEAPELFAGIAAEAAARYGLLELGPALRERGATAPSAPLLRALGELGDRESIPLLLRLLETRADLRTVTLETLGRIGGPAARMVLQATARNEGPDVRVAYKALAACAVAGDDALFREASSHPDWHVRLASVEVLGRIRNPENTSVLARLAGDPVPAVAHRALSVLES